MGEKITVTLKYEYGKKGWLRCVAAEMSTAEFLRLKPMIDELQKQLLDVGGGGVDWTTNT